MAKTDIIGLILRELLSADSKHARMDGHEEGVETLKCEVQELYRETKRKEIDMPDMIAEAVQVAAMAVKFLRDCCDLDGLDLAPELSGDPQEIKPIPDRIKDLGLSLRGRDWQKFSDRVLEHIENYTVPQYGDKGDDRASEYTEATISEHIGRYQDRIGSNSRGNVEAARDMIKIAHYASLGEDIIRHKSAG